MVRGKRESRWKGLQNRHHDIILSEWSVGIEGSGDAHQRIWSYSTYKIDWNRLTSGAGVYGWGTVHTIGVKPECSNPPNLLCACGITSEPKAGGRLKFIDLGGWPMGGLLIAP